MHTRKSYPYDHFQRLGQQILEIDESLQALRYRWKHRLLLKTQTLLNPKIFSSMRVKPRN
jgi:hypothetical protein